MPLNGHAQKGLSHFVRKANVLIITVYTFQRKNGIIEASLSKEQSQWLDEVLQTHADAKFKIVQGHVPIWGKLNSRASSRLKLKNGRNSPFYKTMQKHEVDLYLCGEFHDLNVHKSDGLWQIVHGNSWGRDEIPTHNYLVANATLNKLFLTMKRIYIEPQGGYMWNLNKNPGPRERIDISPRTRNNGPEIIGQVILQKNDGQKQFKKAIGVFR